MEFRPICATKFESTQFLWHHVAEDSVGRTNKLDRNRRLRWWIMLRLVPPLLLAAATLWLRHGAAFMDSFLGLIWIGFAIHSLGWFFNRKHLVTDAIGFMLLMCFYSRVADVAFHLRNFSEGNAAIVIVSFASYLFLTFLAWSYSSEKVSE